MGEAHDLKPHLVVGEVAEREVAHAGVFVVADVVLDPAAAAVIAFQDSDRAGLVGEDCLEAMPVVIGERQLRAGCARSRLTITREPSGQLLRSSWPVISAPARWDAPVRSDQASRPQSRSVIWRIAARIVSVRS
jgi:hypothetical protein